MAYHSDYFINVISWLNYILDFKTIQLIINHLWPLDTHLSASINPFIVMTIKKFICVT